MNSSQQLRFVLVLMVLLGGCRGKSARDPGALHKLVRQGDLSGLERALAHGADINARDEGGYTLLHASMAGSHADIAALLIAQGANLDAQDSEGETALHLAVWKQDDALVQLLVKHGARLDLVDKFGQTPAARAMNRDREGVVRFLVAAGAPVTLSLAVYLNDPAQAGKLLASGADVNARDTYACAALHWAAWLGRAELAKLLLEHGADPTVRNATTKNTPLEEAAQFGQVEVVRVLLAHGANPNAEGEYAGRPLYKAVARGAPAMVALLLDAGAKPDATDGFDCSVLNLAVDRAIGPNPRSEDKEIVQLLLARGATVDTDARMRGLLLLFAAKYGLKDLAERLRTAGDIGVDDSLGGPADGARLFLAIMSGQKDMVELLLAAGADVNARDDAGNTPLHAGARGGDVGLAQLLLDHGARANAQNTEGVTPVHEAVHGGHKAMVEFLVARGLDLSIADVHGDTPLHYATHEDPDITASLLAHGAGVAILNQTGETPLHQAATRGKREIVALLLAHGADANVKDNAGHTPLDRAQAYGRTEVVELLRQARNKSGAAAPAAR